MADDSTCRWCDQGTLFGPVHLYTGVTGSMSGHVSAATARVGATARQ